MSLLRRYPGLIPGSIGVLVFIGMIFAVARLDDNAAGTDTSTTSTASVPTTSPDTNAPETSAPRATVAPPSTSAAPPVTVQLPVDAEQTSVPAGRYGVFDVREDDTLNVRSGPGTDYNVVSELAFDATDVFTNGLAARAGNGWIWIRVRTSDGTVGWAFGSYLELLSPS